MHSDFQNYILNEIEEDGDSNFSLLLPIFKKINYNYNISYPCFKHKENYDIREMDFLDLKHQILDLIQKENLKFVKYVPNKYSERWIDQLEGLNIKEIKNILSEKDNWNYYKSEEKDAYFIIRDE